MAAKRFLLMVVVVVVVVVEGGAAVEFAYEGFRGAGLLLDGMATVTPAGLLLLTNDTNMASSQKNYTVMSKGHAFHPDRVRFGRPAAAGAGGGFAAGVSSFSTTFVFAIVSEFLDLSTSGFAFLVAPSTDLSTAMPQQYLGMFNGTDNGDSRNHVFAVEFDTVRNPEFADINNNHVGVDVNSLNSSAAEPAGYYDDGDGAFRNLSLISREPMQVWVDYDAAAAVVTVAMAPARRPRPKRPLLSAKVNLSTVITDTAYVGFSSASSIVLVKHYVIGWSFSLGGDAPALDYAKLPKLPRIGPKPRSKALTIALPIATTAAVLAAVAVGFLLLRRRRRYAELREDWEVEFGPHRFAYKDLYDATGGFKDKRLLGAGGFGRVYSGVLPGSRTQVAVKKVSHESRQGMKEFVAEVVSIGRLRHRNLVQLLGYCRRKGELLLVYDYMPNGSLDKHLHYHGDDDRPVLDWARRLHIIRGVAAGLLYMHEVWEKVVIHRDIKASNVLLDGDMNGRLGDFGLARLYDHGDDPHTTHVVGTMGYLAPELVRTGKATTLSDVFAFGAFVLEVACGRRPIEEEEEEEEGVDGAAAGDRFVLVDWVLGHWREGSTAGAVDARLGSDYDAAEAELVLRLGLACLHPSPAARPSMRQVTQYLDGSAPLPELPTTYFLDLSTSGFAFLVAPSTDLSTAMPNQYLGVFNGTDNGDARNRIFAVEFDTVRNPEFADINNNHVGVDVNSLNSSAAAPAGYYDDATGAFRNLSLISREPMQVWVDYDAATTEITVAMAPARSPRPKRPLLSKRIDLSTVITDTACVGFSSASSIVLVKHYVLGWSFSLDGDAPALDYAKLPKLARIGPKPQSKGLTIALPVAATVTVLAVVAIGVLLLLRRLRYAELREDWEVEFGPQRFAFKDLYDATGGFKDKWLLGAGGFGTVYKGVLPGPVAEIAVKKVSHHSRQGMKEFVAEVVSIGHLRHRNLVQLLGYCRRKGELLLVYDYMPNGSLGKHLHCREDKPVLSWAQRLHIIRGVAAGLLYMHEDWKQVVIHRDIKASNVLLDGEMNGRLGDFGLARLHDHGDDPQTTRVVGTMGYLAPELVRAGKATARSDVFAFGVFLLEVACGRRPVEEDAGTDTDTDTSDCFVLVDWVLGHWRNGSITSAVDARLGSGYDVVAADLVLRLGLACLHPSPAARPSMRQVTQYLDGSAPLPELPATDMSFTTFAGMGRYQPLFDSWSVRQTTTAAMSVATISDIGLSGGR
nr:L-type lectin-domain containing receptor kinase IV.1-like [Setaria viridis]